MKTKKTTTSGKLFVFVAMLVLLASIGLPCPMGLAETSEADNKITSRFSTKIGLAEGSIKLSYSSDTDKLELVYCKGDEKKEYEVSFSSEKQLGLLIVADRKWLSYSVKVLESGEDWNPFEGEIDASEYRTRARLSRKPGWEIMVVEKLESRSAVDNSEFSI